MRKDHLLPQIKKADSGRRSFLRQASLAGAAAGAAVLLEGTAQAQGLNHGDRKKTKATFLNIQRHENDHVAFLVGALGAAARPKPTFQNLVQPHFHQFLKVSQALENTGVGAYLGAAPALSNPAYLAAAGSIGFIEARHAGWLNSLLEDPITANVNGGEQSFEAALTATQVVDLAAPFIVSLNGGPPVDYSVTPSAANDIAILNFALALEYLEAEFYNLNVANF